MSNMESGKMYALSEIFRGENNKVVIPDLQRDYCWPEHNLVEPFVRSLIELSNAQKGKEQDLTMGLIYGYYDKELAPEHLQLCDGQQRLTTLFLMIGVIFRRLGGKEFQDLLMSDFELNEDDHEPYLQYAIRESSLYFLSDFTYYYFLGKGGRIENVDSVRSQPWFLSNYSLDPTVNNILSATEMIEGILKGWSQEQLSAFGSFITTKLKFLFYDMEDRANGEETFVLINTTGEPLSPTQNLKSLVIEHNKDSANVACRWEEMETWFWQNRHKTGTDYPHTADEGMECFFNVVRLLYSKSEEEAYKAIEASDTFPYEEIHFEQIYNAFKVYKELTVMDFSERLDKAIAYPKKEKFYTQKELYAIVPTMQYCLKKFRTAGPEDITAGPEDIKRIYHLFSNISRYTNVQREKDKDGKLHSRTYQAKLLVENMSEPDYLCLRDKINDEEVIAKMDMVARLVDEQQRIALEKLFAEAEVLCIFNGKIGILVSWSDNLESFRHYWGIFKALFNKGEKDGYTDDIVRRAIIASSWEHYPIKECFFGYRPKEWHEIIKQNEDQFRHFLDEINETEWGKIEAKLEAKIKAMPEGRPWHDFAEHSELLGYCNTKHLHNGFKWYGKYGWQLVKNNRARHFSVYNMRLLIELKERYERKVGAGWDIWPWTNKEDWDSCVVFERNTRKEVALDIRRLRAEGNNIIYNVTVFHRDREHNDYDALAPYRLDEFEWEKTEGGCGLTNLNDKKQLFRLIDHFISTYATLTEERQ